MEEIKEIKEAIQKVYGPVMIEIEQTFSGLKYYHIFEKTENQTQGRYIGYFKEGTRPKKWLLHHIYNRKNKNAYKVKTNNEVTVRATLIPFKHKQASIEIYEGEGVIIPNPYKWDEEY